MAASTATHRSRESRSCVPPIGVGTVKTRYILGSQSTSDAWVALGGILSVCVPQFLYLYDGDNAGAYHMCHED